MSEPRHILLTFVPRWRHVWVTTVVTMVLGTALFVALALTTESTCQCPCSQVRR